VDGEEDLGHERQIKLIEIVQYVESASEPIALKQPQDGDRPEVGIEARVNTCFVAKLSKILD
jgi:hypothetical protein